MKKEALSYLSAGLGGHLEGGLEGPSLLSGQDGSWSFGPPGILPIIPLPLAPYAFLRLDVQLLIVTFLCRKSHFSASSAQAWTDYTLSVSDSLLINTFLFFHFSGRFTHHKCIIKGDTCVSDTLLSICYKRKRPHVRSDLQQSVFLAGGEHNEICTFVIELDVASLVIYRSQLCLIYTESISDKNTTSSATWKRKHEYMWEMHLAWHSRKVQFLALFQSL